MGSENPASQPAEREHGRPWRKAEIRDGDRGGQASLQPSIYEFQAQMRPSCISTLGMGGPLFPCN